MPSALFSNHPKVIEEILFMLHTLIHNTQVLALSYWDEIPVLFVALFIVLMLPCLLISFRQTFHAIHDSALYSLNLFP